MFFMFVMRVFIMFLYIIQLFMFTTQPYRKFHVLFIIEYIVSIFFILANLSSMSVNPTHYKYLDKI